MAISAIRFAVYRSAAMAMRHPMWVSALLGDVARVVAWGAVAIFLGLIVGLAAVVLPR